MSAIPNSHAELDPRIDGLLGRLKQRIRLYVVIEGIALVVCLLCIAFWLAFGIDALYFAVRRLELPKWFRIGYTLLTVGLFVVAILALLVFRLVRRFRAKALALVLERRFPELDDRLVTAVEMSETPPEHVTELSQAMLNRTIGDVVRDSDDVEVGQVFDQGPIVRAVVVGAVLLTLTSAYCLANPDGADRFRKAFIGFDDEYWDRETKLLVRVVAQPGDVVKDFRFPVDHELAGTRTGGEPGVYKHPKGSPLELRIVVPADTLNHEGNPWKVPTSDVRVRYRQDDGKGNSGKAFASEDVTLIERENGLAVFVYNRDAVEESHDLWVTGGDYTNRRPYRIEVVEPPQIDATLFDCDFPAYTGLNEFEAERLRRVSGNTHALPEETRFVYSTTTNKPIVGARLVFGDVELTFGPEFDEQGNAIAGSTVGESRIRLENDGVVEWRTNELDPDTLTRFLREDGLGFRVPFVVSRRLTDVAIDRTREPFADLGVPFVIAPGTQIRVFLSDIDGIESVDPETITVDGIEDVAPVFDEVDRKAIGRFITARASIPFKGGILDDFGLAKARFDFRVDRGSKHVNEEEAALAEQSKRWLARKFERFPAPLTRVPETSNRLLAASVSDESETWFLELLGPRERVGEVAREVNEFYRSIRETDGELGWTLPDDWRERPDGTGRRLFVGDSGLSIKAWRQEGVPADFDAFILANVNRWRDKVDLDDFTPEDLETEPGFETSRGSANEATVLVDFASEHPRVLPLGGDAEEAVERFDVRPLDLKVGHRLIITLYAEDADNLNGPHFARSTDFEFEIVSPTDLEAMQYDREMDLLEQLLQVIREVRNTRSDLDEKRGVASTRDDLLDDGAARQSQDKILSISAERGLHQIRTAAVESKTVENSFSEILAELSNNLSTDGVENDHLKWLRTAIVEPLGKANDKRFPELDGAIGSFKVGLEDDEPVAGSVDDSIDAADELLVILEKVAKELDDRVNYLRAVKNLKSILEDEDRLRQATEKKQAQQLIDGLGDDLKKLEGLQD